MNGLREIVEAATRADREGRGAVLATVVKVAGSTYRKPGARMLFPDSGNPVGMISGGCLEADLAERAREVLDGGAPQTVVYDMRSPDDIVWGLGLGCNGEVRLLLERLEPGRAPAYLEFLGRCVRERRPAVVATIFAAEGGAEQFVGRRVVLDERTRATDAIDDETLTERIMRDAGRALSSRRSTVERYASSGATLEVLVEYVPPAIALLILGAGSDAPPLAHIAKQLGWLVTVADDRAGHLTPERFPAADRLVRVDFPALDGRSLAIDAHTAVVVMTHHFLHDLDAMQFLLATDAAYLGFLGPRQRLVNLLDELARRGARPTADQRARLFGPVGLDIGSRTPEEIALAVLAEIRAVLSGRSGAFLRDRHAPLHEWPE